MNISFQHGIDIKVKQNAGKPGPDKLSSTLNGSHPDLCRGIVSKACKIFCLYKLILQKKMQGRAVPQNNLPDSDVAGDV